MPSLNDLGQFKFSFNGIGMGKDADGQPKKPPYEDLALPTTEAAPMDFPVRNPDAMPEDAGGFDFGAFFDSLPKDDIDPPPLDDFFMGTASADESSSETAGGEFSMDDLLGSMNLGDTTPPDDFPMDTPPADTPSMDDLLGGMNLGGDTPADDFPIDTPPADEPSMGDLLGSIDLGGETPADDFSMDAPPSDEPSMDDLLGGMNLDTEAPADDFSMDTPPSDESSMGDLLGSIDLGGETPADDFSMDAPPSDEPSMSDLLGDMDISGGTPADDFPMDIPPSDEPSMGDLLGSMDIGGMNSGSEIIDDPIIDAPLDDPIEVNEGIDLGGESIGSVEEDTMPLDGGGMSFDESLPDTGIGDFGDFGDFGSTDFGDAGFDASAGEFDAGAGEMETSPENGMDLGDFGSDFETDSIELGSEQEAEHTDFGSGGFGSETGSSDFALDGLDELFDKSKPEPIAPKPKKSFWKRKKTEEDFPEAESDIEEIQLTQDEVDRLLATIASYPLNLRITCEELIAEQVLLPQQLSKLVRSLINGAHVREMATLVEEITGKPVIIPKSYEKMTGAAFEAEQTSFAYIFFHNFLPVLRLFAVIAAIIASTAYLGYKFIYIPVKAENLYKRGYERIPEGEYQRANQLFDEAFSLHRKKKWFYLYAESFRDQRRYMLAEEKYDQLLKYYPRDKKGVLDYASLNTYYLLNYDKANRLLQQQLLDFSPNDYEGLLASGDNFLHWADSDPARFYDKYEDARFSYARLLELRGWQVPIVERMLRYFIRTDNLKEVLYLRHWFESDKKRRLSPPSLTELAGYLLDKQMEEVKGVPDPYLEGIYSVRAMLLQAIAEDPYLPESHYHLARYHKNLNNTYEERLTLENAVRAFNLVQTETVRRRLYRVDTHFRYSNLLVGAKEFFPAEEQIVKSIELYEDFLSRNLIRATPQLGQLYAGKGDIEYFVKSGNMEAALADYHKAEGYGYSPPEIQYRIGAAYYQLENWKPALEYLFNASSDLPLNRRMLYALGNAAYRRGDYFAAQGYYDRLLDILENQRVRLPVLLPNDNPQFLELGERLMMARNNMGVIYEALADQTGNREYRSRAMSLYAESARAWDSITRNPATMTRMSLVDTPGAPGINQGYMNAHHSLRPGSGYIPQIFPRIDKDVLEPSRWEELAGAGGLQ
ncbi:MAG: tetratricopeptide repeat protein [Treponema sp.]|jgi:tetratricopeptide (TPR) repeat protein|nr:tetratricopeptide repeat protein [Treponema sp.]